MSLRRRLAKSERNVADIEERKRLASCICLEVQTAIPGRAHEFEAEMNRAFQNHLFVERGEAAGPPQAHRSLRVAFSLVVVLLAFFFVFRFFVFLVLVSGNSSKRGVGGQRDGITRSQPTLSV
jgi:hypothetical protein